MDLEFHVLTLIKAAGNFLVGVKNSHSWVERENRQGAGLLAAGACAGTSFLALAVDDVVISVTHAASHAGYIAAATAIGTPFVVRAAAAYVGSRRRLQRRPADIRNSSTLDCLGTKGWHPEPNP